jgi:septum formation protein
MRRSRRRSTKRPAKESLIAGGISAPRDLSDALAELKALKVSRMAPGALVLGCDSVVALDDGVLLDKPVSRDNAAEHLRR